MRDVILIGEAITKRAYLTGNPKALVRLMLVHHALFGKRFENSVDGRARDLQFTGKFRGTDAVPPVQQCQNIQASAK